jgi:WD40 repeat protein
MGMINRLGTLLLLGLFPVFALIACSSGPQDQIVGKWTSLDGPQAIEFFKDGDCIFTSSGKSVPCKYKLLENNRIRLDITTSSTEVRVTTGKIQLSADRLDMIPEEPGITPTRLVRVKDGGSASAPKLPTLIGPAVTQAAVPPNPTPTGIWGTEVISPANAGKIKQLAKLGAGLNYNIAFSPDGQTLAMGYIEGVGLHRINDLPMPSNRGFKIGNGGNQVGSVAYSSDSKILAIGCKNGQVQIWDTTADTKLRTFYHQNSIGGLAFSLDGKMLASASNDKTVKLWDPSNGKELRTLGGHTEWVEGLAFSPDGKMLASASCDKDKTVKLWDPSNGKELRALSGTSCVNSVAFSPDGKVLASGSDLEKVKLWDVFSGKELYNLGGELNIVNAVAFSPDGKELAIGSNDGFVYMWGVR